MIKPKIIRKLEGKISCLLKKPSRLRERLLREGRTRWLDVGSSTFNSEFHCLNLVPPSEVREELRARYFQADLLHMKPDDFRHLGEFDLVRMQHVFEHFSLEESQTVLQVCAKLLKPGGYLLITVPDLAVHVQSYLDGYRLMRPFREFARGRVGADAPTSFIFGFHVHQGGYSENMVPGDAHKWCYDRKGLEYQVRRSGLFSDIRTLGLLHPDANIPFTHNRPHEDLVVLATQR
jgi:SAM-dependent methyltransferase